MTVPFGIITSAAIMLGRGPEALGYSGRALALAPESPAVLRTLAADYAASGHEEGARQTLGKLLRSAPGACVSAFCKSTNFTQTPISQRYLEARRLAGLPEDPA